MDRLAGAGVGKPGLNLAAARPPLLAGVPQLWLLPGRRQDGHALLRGILADYLACPAAAVPLRACAGAAPQVDADGQGRLGLSLSYAGGQVLIGLCAGAQLGVDLVRVEPLPDWQEVAALYLGPDVCTTLEQIPQAQRAIAFAQAWAELEARAKCLGEGLAEWSAAAAQRRAACCFEALASGDFRIGVAWQAA